MGSPTKEKKKKHGLGMCVLCRGDDETIGHLLIKFQFDQQVWIEEIQNVWMGDFVENQIITYINNLDFSLYHGGHQILTHILDKTFQENCTVENLLALAKSMLVNALKHESSNVVIEIHPGKTLNINSQLEEFQKQQLIKILKQQTGAFAWEYTYMRGIQPNTCIHHISLEENSRPIRQPHR